MTTLISDFTEYIKKNARFRSKTWITLISIYLNDDWLIILLMEQFEWKLLKIWNLPDIKSYHTCCIEVVWSPDIIDLYSCPRSSQQNICRHEEEKNTI